jgi:hypothetical protein
LKASHKGFESESFAFCLEATWVLITKPITFVEDLEPRGFKELDGKTLVIHSGDFGQKQMRWFIVNHMTSQI